MTGAERPDGPPVAGAPDAGSGDAAAREGSAAAGPEAPDRGGAHATPVRDEPAPAGARKPVRRLALGDPVARTATEDRPESWGERGESDAERLAHYRAQRPPHHGG